VVETPAFCYLRIKSSPESFNDKPPRRKPENGLTLTEHNIKPVPLFLGAPLAEGCMICSNSRSFPVSTCEHTYAVSSVKEKQRGLGGDRSFDSLKTGNIDA
jgi:hypothetical protein